MEENFELTKEYSLRFDELRKEVFKGTLRNNAKYIYDDNFDAMRKNRIEVSFYKYGPVRRNYGPTGHVSAIGSYKNCIQKYKDTKNTEYLLDAVNYLMFEYMWPKVQRVAEPNFNNITDTNDTWLTEAQICIEQYLSGGGTSCLVAASVFVQAEFINPSYNDAYFKATESKDSAGIDGFSVKECM